MLGNEYWINFQEPESDRTPYVRIFNKKFILKRLDRWFVLSTDDKRTWAFMYDRYHASSVAKLKMEEMIDEIEGIIPYFFKDVYNIDFKPFDFKPFDFKSSDFKPSDFKPSTDDL